MYSLNVIFRQFSGKFDSYLQDLLVLLARNLQTGTVDQSHRIPTPQIRSIRCRYHNQIHFNESRQIGPVLSFEMLNVKFFPPSLLHDLGIEPTM